MGPSLLQRLALCGWRQLAVGGWRLVVVGGWRLVVGGGWWSAVGGWWWLAAGGGWQLVVSGGCPCELPSTKKKMRLLKDSLASPSKPSQQPAHIDGGSTGGGVHGACALIPHPRSLCTSVHFLPWFRLTTAPDLRPPHVPHCTSALVILLQSLPPPPPQGLMAPEAVRQAVGGGCRSGWGRLLSVTDAVELGTWRQEDSGWA